MSLIVVFVDSSMVQQPKSISSLSNDISEFVTTALTVNGTGAVCREKEILSLKLSNPSYFILHTVVFQLTTIMESKY